MSKQDIIKKKKGEVIHEAKIDGDNTRNDYDFKIIIAIIVVLVLFGILFL